MAACFQRFATRSMDKTRLHCKSRKKIKSSSCPSCSSCNISDNSWNIGGYSRGSRLYCYLKLAYLTFSSISCLLRLIPRTLGRYSLNCDKLWGSLMGAGLMASGSSHHHLPTLVAFSATSTTNGTTISNLRQGSLPSTFVIPPFSST